MLVFLDLLVHVTLSFIMRVVARTARVVMLTVLNVQVQQIHNAFHVQPVNSMLWEIRVHALTPAQRQDILLIAQTILVNSALYRIALIVRMLLILVKFVMYQIVFIFNPIHAFPALLISS